MTVKDEVLVMLNLHGAITSIMMVKIASFDGISIFSITDINNYKFSSRKTTKNYYIIILWTRSPKQVSWTKIKVLTILHFFW